MPGPIKPNRLLYVYIAGPYSLPDPSANVGKAIDVADTLLSLGFAPYVPHLSHHWNERRPRRYEDWIALDLLWLDRCDAVYRLPGNSPGADKEVEYALANGIPVYHDLRTLLRALADIAKQAAAA